MVFSSLPCLFFFLPRTVIVYFIAPKKMKNAALLSASLIFYAWGEPVYILLMIFSSVVDYTNGRMIERYGQQPRKKKAFLILSIIINLSLLGFFKYSGFFVGNFYNLFHIGLRSFNVPLPIGISFYTFQTMSYSIDVYRGHVKAERNFLNFMTYVCMFPQLIAGPIVRYKTISEQLHARTVTVDDFSAGCMRMIRGLGKKVLLANNIGLLFETAAAGTDPSVALSWMTVIAFGFQIYFDFSGYSDMAIGIGIMLGFSYNENFNYPYIAKSITDFWRRWHISLSTFFRDYLYITLGGNRVSIASNIANIMIVWLLTGFWHGANWNFILWGVYYGLILVIEKYLLKNILAKLPDFIKHVYAIFFILLGWVIFAFEDVQSLMHFSLGLFGGGGIPAGNTYALYMLRNYFVTIVLCGLFSTPLMQKLAQKFKSFPPKAQPLLSALKIAAYIAIFVLSVAYIVDDTFNPFLYFRF
jgi:alginate O-acetyltransferase complex protein AlgI